MSQLQSQTDPAEFAYQTGLKHKQLSKFESVDDMKSALRDELKAELLEDLKKEQSTAAAALETVPDSVSEKPTQANVNTKPTGEEFTSPFALD